MPAWNAASDKQKLELLRADIETLMRLHKAGLMKTRAEIQSVQSMLNEVAQAVVKLQRQVTALSKT
jgi:hypothetical protein